MYRIKKVQARSSRSARAGIVLSLVASVYTPSKPITLCGYLIAQLDSPTYVVTKPQKEVAKSSDVDVLTPACACNAIETRAVEPLHAPPERKRKIVFTVSF